MVTTLRARPLLKWVGGKRQLLPALQLYYPTSFDRYTEVFAGSGAVFFDLYASGRLHGRPATLADVNPDLIGCYRVVRDQTEAVIAVLGELEREHRARGADCYYDVRDRRFNRVRAAFPPGDPTLAHQYTAELAAMLIYLNRTGFNGLFRLNRRGEYNVPVGRYSEPRICEPEHVRSVARAFSEDTVTLECSSFERVLAKAGAGDFVYCDPPYAPLSRTSAFANYTSGGFGRADQETLQAAVTGAARRGAVVILSNSSAPEIVSAYSSRQAREAGLTVTLVPARRAVNSRASARGPVNEVIVTNMAHATSKLQMAKSSLRASTVRPVSHMRQGRRTA